MMGSRRSRRVSWAAGGNLCKVRLFLSEDSPSQAGLRPQDNLQAKGSWLLHAAGPSADDSLPPGFESLPPSNNLKIDISQIPLIRWKCPPHILLDQDWHIVSGEESKEIEIQNERINGVLEAIYPRPSNIPPNPFLSSDVKDSHFDDSKTLLVPLIPLEDDDASDQLEGPPLDLPNNYQLSDKYDSANINAQRVSKTPITTEQQQPCGYIGAISSGITIQPDVEAAARAIIQTVQSNQNGSMIDKDLLFKILSDPSQLERLMKECGPTRPEQSSSSSAVSPSVSIPPPQITANAPAPFSDHMGTFHSTNPTLPPPPPMMNRLPSTIPSVDMNPLPSSSPAMNYGSVPARGIGYYKTLIHQHGGERQEHPFEQHGMQFGMYRQPGPPQNGGVDGINGASMVSRDAKVRPMKPCAYFNGPKGCRNGANCTFLHDASAPTRKDQKQKGSKRIKLDNAIGGRN
ncbi:zinc finger CCCH domain-containing protein 30 [Oryza brachyantha]|uniref:C3H1-type domain-containing protein n=1 Tax=Oryza brachyantha TaxID=4533 RepID=J3M2C6_ORYBR|nr:zinc finger CCCH domain-containing protein 30 [Oryza brachyantha]